MVKKIDFYCGAFLSYLIFNGITPALFEAGEKSRIVKFSTNLGDFKVYMKYTTNCNQSDKKTPGSGMCFLLKKKWIFSRIFRR